METFVIGEMSFMANIATQYARKAPLIVTIVVIRPKSMYAPVPIVPGVNKLENRFSIVWGILAIKLMNVENAAGMNARTAQCGCEARNSV